MTLAARELLRRLAPALRPVAGVAASHGALGGADFGGLLERAQRGALRSDRPLDASGLTLPLDAEAIERLGGALDFLETCGVRRAILLYGGRGLVADVPSRRFEADVAAQEPPNPIEVEVALRVATPEEPAPGESRRPLGPPAVGIASPSLLEILAARDSHEDPGVAPQSAVDA